MEKFTIIITTYNRLPFLKVALKSALIQTVPCEIIVVDDGSSDGTEAYMRSLGNRIIYCRNCINRGHSAAVNRGVKLASNQWIKLLDDDDYLEPQCIEVLTQAICDFPNAVICSGQVTITDSQGKKIGQTKTYTNSSFCVHQEDIHYGMLLDMLPLGTPVQVAFNKQAFLKSQGWDSTFDGNYDDIDSWSRICQYGDVLFINHLIGYRRLWTGSCHKQLSLQKRCEMNIKIKQNIYKLVHNKHQKKLPKILVIQSYVRWHWFFVALKKRTLLTGIKLVVFSPYALGGLELLFKIYYVKQFRLFFQYFTFEFN